MTKLIKTEAEHAAALAEIDRLLPLDPEPGTPDGDRLELLGFLVEAYEKGRFPVGLPDPVEAVKFCMEQRGLTPRDLTPYLGSASRVSEVMARKRPVNLAMARKLHAGLGIPAGIFLRDPAANLPPPVEVERFPLAEMVRRGWFPGFKGRMADARRQAEELLQEFFGRSFDLAAVPALHRQNVRAGSAQDPYALCAWKARVLHKAEGHGVAQPFARERIAENFLHRLVGLSVLREGPRLAAELLAQQGIRLVVERHLPGTHLDGAALQTAKDEPVIGLTLRHDRLDNFWFTLLHELGHVVLHLGEADADAFFDDLDSVAGELESEADRFAANALIAETEWETFRRRGDWSVANVRRCALHWNVNAAVVAGRIRKETNNYRILSPLVGSGDVRPLFAD
jgi:HTH-type transcriptional regulator/antitoxin HigA